uniref:Leucine rich repeat containing 32 n=1 Tax=Loxodonta africana TaxID=9785 RepID=G3U512_LOXAF
EPWEARTLTGVGAGSSNRKEVTSARFSVSSFVFISITSLSVNKEVLCQGLGLPQVPSMLPLDIEVLNLSGNQLRSILASPLVFYTALRHLDLSTNEISFVQPGVFQALPHLEHLNLAHNHLAHAPSEGWSALPLSNPSWNTSTHPLSQLLNLDLSYNEIEHIPEGFLEPLTSLRFLNLSRNCMRAFEARHVGSLPCLVLLDLSHNALQALELGARALGALRTLLLQGNTLQGLPPYTFANLASLQKLNLQGNQAVPWAAWRPASGAST